MARLQRDFGVQTYCSKITERLQGQGDIGYSVVKKITRNLILLLKPETEKETFFFMSELKMVNFSCMAIPLCLFFICGMKKGSAHDANLLFQYEPNVKVTDSFVFQS